MVRHTRKVGKQHKGGGTYMLPGIDAIDTLEDFEKEWDTYYLSAHGILMEDEPMITIPKNVYILFMGNAGTLCYNSKLTQEFEQCLIKREDKCGVRHGTYETNFLPVMKNLKKVFPYIYDPTKITIQSPSEDVSTSIYEPGDKIYDIFLEFMNTNYYAIRGLFQVPLEKDFVTDIVNMIGDSITIDKTTIDRLTDNILAKDGNLIKPLLSQMREKKRTDPSYNKYSMNLSFILKSYEQELTQSDKKTFIVIKTCRGTVNESQETMKRIRRHSVELRKYNVPLPWTRTNNTKVNTITNTKTRRTRKAIAPKKKGPPSYDEVYKAIEKDNAIAIRKYVKEGFQINEKYASEYPIFDVIALGKSKVFNEFIKLGANVHVKNNLGMTTVFVAANKRQITMLETLLEKGVDPNEEDDAGDFPINRAFARENLNMIKLLIRYGARINDFVIGIANAEDEYVAYQNPEIKKIVDDLRHYDYKNDYSDYFD
jgi:ankyrin repeat protein